MHRYNVIHSWVIASILAMLFTWSPVIGQTVSEYFEQNPSLNNDQAEYINRLNQLAQNTTVTDVQQLQRNLRETAILQNRFDNETKEAYEAAYGLILDEDFESAVLALRDFKKNYETNPWSDDAEFWFAYASEKARIIDQSEAFLLYQSFLENYQNSNWSDDAKTNMIRLARSLEKSGNNSYMAAIEEIQADEEEKLVLTAIMALQNTGDEETIGALQQLYENSTNSAVRGRIVQVMGNTHTQQAVDILIDIARDDDEDNIRIMAIRQLGNIINSSSAYSIGRMNSVTKVIEYVPVSNIDKDELSHTLKEIAIEDKSSDVRNAAFTVLAYAPAEISLDFLIDAASSGDDYTIRRMAIEALGRSNDPRAKQALIDIIKSMN